MIHGTRVGNASPGKDPLKIEGGPMTRSRAKQVKETMRLLVQATMDEMQFVATKEASFMLSSRVESRWMNSIQVLDKAEDVPKFH